MYIWVIKDPSNDHFYRPKHLILTVWPDWAIFCTLGNHSKHLTTIILPKSPTFLVNFCKGVKIIHFYSEIILGNFYRRLAIFIGHTGPIYDRRSFKRLAVGCWSLVKTSLVTSLALRICFRLQPALIRPNILRWSLRCEIERDSALHYNDADVDVDATFCCQKGHFVSLTFHDIDIFLNGQLPASFLRLCTFFQSNFTK